MANTDEYTGEYNDEYNDEYLCRDFFVGFNFWSRLGHYKLIFSFWSAARIVFAK